MSGGSFNYVGDRALDDATIFNTIDDLIGIESYLREASKYEAADMVREFRFELIRLRDKAHQEAERMWPLLRAAEWWASFDISESDFDDTWNSINENAGS